MAGDALCWIIDVDGRCCSQVRLHQLAVNRRARPAVGLLAPELFGHGYGTEAARRVLAHAFGPLRLHRVDLRVLDINVRAIRSYEKCGCVREGVERETVYVEGNWLNAVAMCILEHEYR